ncbi:aldolase [Cupriavidus alkaliphilus]|uniref:aldolase n=1 Tax=Cupriavidus alkaliphilus TaxID=942866 RepID=UPI000DC4A993|nr:aldolase [Cupriavidus alkaliphilus]MBB2919469.1 L-fuculose-phosphate aldolase [Cupriavidus alkaliphilus]MBB3015695.1 L-fuculose-phosphate aldolase [Cupriavidus alkaliphilus]RAS09418.1 L-fuculose-phosphate aldolase [Cupriavidus alkaliphilus]
MKHEDRKSFTDDQVRRLASGLQLGAWTEEEKIALACRMLALEGHSRSLAGQITVRSADGTFLTTPLAVGFDEVDADQIIRIDESINVIQGRGAANPAIRFHLWIYRERPDVNCIIHTHPPYVSALSMTGMRLRVAHMDATPFADDCGFLAEWPGLPIADSEGKIIATALGQNRSVLLAHHGFLCATGSIEESAYLSMLIENAAQLQLIAESTGSVAELDPDLARESHDFLLRPEIVQASFAMFARRAVRASLPTPWGSRTS